MAPSSNDTHAPTSPMAGPKEGGVIGDAVRRVEDARLLTGLGEYSDDYNLPGQAHAAVARSDHAHARVLSIDVDTAAAMPGVLAVLTGADCRADGLRPLIAQGNPTDVALKNRDGSPIQYPPIDLLAMDKVRRVGEAVALIIAETPFQARDAAEQIHVDYDPLPAVSEPIAALAPDAPRLWDDAANNLCVDDQKGDVQAVADAFAKATHVTRLAFNTF